MVVCRSYTLARLGVSALQSREGKLEAARNLSACFQSGTPNSSSLAPLNIHSHHSPYCSKEKGWLQTRICERLKRDMPQRADDLFQTLHGAKLVWAHPLYASLRMPETYMSFVCFESLPKLRSLNLSV